jgi:leucyl aminopeptidase
MSITLKQHLAIADEKSLDAHAHLLFVLPAERPDDLPFSSELNAKLNRIGKKYTDLSKSPVMVDLPNGAVASWVVLDAGLSVFKRQTQLRKAIKPLLDEHPKSLAIAVFGGEAARHKAAKDAFYVVSVNAVELPERKGKAAKKDSKPRQLKSIVMFGWQDPDAYVGIQALVNGSVLTRTLTMTPPNELNPAQYRHQIARLAKSNDWQFEEFDMPTLTKMGAGAFVAVGQGSDPQDAAIVHLTYTPKKAKKHIALVGKGICFDTGGHNLKPAKYMSGMHEDMNGSAVALGVLLAVTKAKLPIKIDCWLAIAQNHIGPLAYKQNDVVTALNGTTIEIVHTDAEGRMVLADTLTLASREKPDWMVDFATLTGSMMSALGDRYSGVLGNKPELLCKAVGVGASVGERVCAFPFDDDYDEDIESSIADIKQCTLEGGADHVHATRFLAKFIENDIPWLHVDLSSYNRKGGLGAVASDVNGFGVALTFELLKQY